MRTFVGAGACMLLIGAGACVTAPAASACPFGTVSSDFSGVCVSGGTGGDAAVAPETAPTEGAFIGGPNELPSVDGVPCTPRQLGACIGLSESAG